MLKTPPGNLGLPVIGETISFLREKDFAGKRQEKYGPIFKSHIFGSPTVFILGADANRFLLTNENKYFSSTWPTSTRILLGPNSLATRTGSFHTSRRKLLYQAFQPRALASYIPTMVDITSKYLTKWEKMGTLTWYPELRDYTFDIASQLLVGTPDGSQTPLCKLFEVWVEGLFSIPFALPWTKFGKAKACREDLLTQIEEIVKQRQKQDNSGEDALGLLLQAKDEQGNSLSLAELKDQILLLLFAGHETLTSAVASFCLLMAQHPDVVDIAREEQEKLGIDLPFTPESLAKMTYLEQVLKETLRLVPPVGGGFREAIADCEYDGYVIPKGWRVQYQIGRTHQDENIYPNSKEFDPDRFNPSRSEDKQKTFAYVPFGGGLRECIGKEFAKLEMKILAAMLLRHYQWELLPEQDLELVTIPTPHPRDNLRVKFSLRQ